MRTAERIKEPAEVHPKRELARWQMKDASRRINRSISIRITLKKDPDAVTSRVIVRTAVIGKA